MTTAFDLVAGEVHLGAATLRADMSAAEVTRSGLAFVNEVDMKTGWVFKMIGPEMLATHRVRSSLGFKDDRLRRVNCGFVDAPSLDDLALFRTHTEFLARELGAPSRQGEREVTYVYAWGRISSVHDPRGGGSFILVTWEASAA